MDESSKTRFTGAIPDLVYNILKDHNTPMHHKDITDRIKEMLLTPDTTDEPRFVARIHTEINLDNRFFHMGNGMWGLREWSPKRAMQQKTPAASHGTSAKAKAPKRPDFWRAETEEDVEEHPRVVEEEDGDWHKENEDEAERPEA